MFILKPYGWLHKVTLFTYISSPTHAAAILFFPQTFELEKKIKPEQCQGKEDPHAVISKKVSTARDGCFVLDIKMKVMAPWWFKIFFVLFVRMKLSLGIDSVSYLCFL